MDHEATFAVRNFDEYGDYYTVTIYCGKKNRNFEVTVRDIEEKIYCPYCGKELKISIKVSAEVKEV